MFNTLNLRSLESTSPRTCVHSKQAAKVRASSVGSSVSVNSSASNVVQRMEEPRPSLSFGTLAIGESSTLPDVTNLPEAQLLHGRNEFSNQRSIAMGSPGQSPIGSPFNDLGSPLIDVGSHLIRGPELQDVFEFGLPEHNSPK